MLREKHKGRKPRGESTDAMACGGPICSSEEGLVMGLERRDREWGTLWRGDEHRAVFFSNLIDLSPDPD